MKFYDLGDNDYDMASPYRLHIPERGLVLSYGKPGAMVFVTTNGYQDDYGREVAGRCVFGTGNERAHADLKKKLGQGERITMRGVLWPEHNVMTVWETFSDMPEFRELMKVVAGGLRDELGMNPENVLLYLGYSHPARGGERNYDMYNVELSVGEACMIDGHGDVNDCFYAMFLKDKATRKDNGDVASNGMRNRDIWRHYEVVGEGKRPIKLSEGQIKGIIKRTLSEKVMPLMNMAGRRESTNVDDRRGQVPNHYEMIMDNMRTLYMLEAYASLSGQDDLFTNLGQDAEIQKVLEQIERAYQLAQKYIGSRTLVQRVKGAAQKGVQTVKNAFNESVVGTGQMQNVNIVAGIKRTIVNNAYLFAGMVKYYAELVKNGKMMPGKAMKTIQRTHDMLINYIPKV